MILFAINRALIKILEQAELQLNRHSQVFFVPRVDDGNCAVRITRRNWLGENHAISADFSLRGVCNRHFTHGDRFREHFDRGGATTVAALFQGKLFIFV